jgi:protease PrsW
MQFSGGRTSKKLIMTIILYLAFGILPSVIWLLFYLRKDSHPESNSMVLKVFFLGMVAAAVAAFIEVAISRIFLSNDASKELAALFPFSFFLVYHFLLVSLIEELAKFFVVKFKVMKSSELDEPVDIMLYMIISALGFAALENLIYILPLLFPGEQMTIYQAGIISFFRFAGATFLHALCSAIIGFFLAYSVLTHKFKLLYLSFGIAVAVLLHGLFNISIIGIEGGLTNKNSLLLISSIGFLIFLLALLSIAVSSGFKKLKKTASVCRIK